MIRIRELSDLNDLVGFTVLVAPDRFPINGTFGPDQVKNLCTAFELINDGFPFIEKKIKDPVKLAQLRQIIDSALAAYQNDENIKGAHLLQDFQNTVFPSRFKQYAERKGEPYP